MRFFALDPGRNVGWAGPDRSSGVEPFLDADHGIALWRFWGWFGAMLDRTRPDKLVIERGYGGNQANGRLTTAIEASAHALAGSRKIPRSDKSAVEVRKWLLGYGRIPAKEIPSPTARDRELDRRILAAVRGLGYAPPNEHAADACALCAWFEYDGMPFA